jgi:tRNA A-37 threonylcarbamoyl transferase component Bud32
MDNKEPQQIRIREGNIDGFIVPELRRVLTAGFFEDLDRQMTVYGGSVVKDSRVRWAATLPIEGGRTLFVKQFRTVGRWQRFRYLIRPSRAMKECLISRFLSQKGILTPKALGILEKRKHGVLKECFFVAEAIEEATDLIDFCKNRFRGPEQIKGKNQILRLLARTTRKLHDSGLFHRDLHGGNFLVTDEGSLSLHLVDLHQARRQITVSKAKRLWNIAQIFNSLDFMLDHEAQKLFLLTYGRGQAPFGRDLDNCLKRVEGMIQKMVKRRQKSRAKRCLKESTLFTIDRRAGLKIFRRREMGENDLIAILEAHREMVHSQREKLLKYSPKTIVSIVSNFGANGLRVCVKEYRYETILDRLRNVFRQPKGKISWVAGNVLFSRGICPMKPLAYAERRRLKLLQEAYYVTESLADDMEMDRYLIRMFEKQAGQDLRKFIRHFAGWIGFLHRTGIYHRDLKTCNILIREKPGGWNFSLIDLEDVIQGAKIGIEKILRNLVQINCSVPRFFTYGDRIRFLKGYLGANPVAMDERAFIKRVLKESRSRGVVYVSPQGVVMEKFE